MPRDEWLRRYRARFEAYQPRIPAETIEQLVTGEAFEVLSEEYPLDPERAAEDEIAGWVESYNG